MSRLLGKGCNNVRFLQLVLEKNAGDGTIRETTNGVMEIKTMIEYLAMLICNFGIVLGIISILSLLTFLAVSLILMFETLNTEEMKYPTKLRKMRKKFFWLSFVFTICLIFYPSKKQVYGVFDLDIPPPVCACGELK